MLTKMTDKLKAWEPFSPNLFLSIVKMIELQLFEYQIDHSLFIF